MRESTSREPATETSARPRGQAGGGPPVSSGASATPPEDSLQKMGPAAAPEPWQRLHPEYYLG
jgi:hypothetical protein